MFVRHINYLKKYLKHKFCLQMTLVCSINFHTLIEEVNIELKKIAVWFNTKKLTLNVTKSNFIIFTPKLKKYDINNAEITINCNKIEQIKLKKSRSTLR